MSWLLLLLLGCGREPVEAPPAPPTYQLDGSWFVRYASDPKPYLDVAFHGDVPARVTATLQGPTKAWEDLTLTWNPKEKEWQIVCTFLPDPLPGGWWFVSKVTAQDSSGRATTWSTSVPWTPYADGSEPGFFYAAEAGPLRYRVETGPAGGGTADPILRVIRADDPTRWVAANDDADVGKPWAAVTFPVQPGEYLVRVYGEEDDAGPYVLRVGPEGATWPDPMGAPDAGETPEKALELTLPASLKGQLAGDVDWYRFEVP